MAKQYLYQLEIMDNHGNKCFSFDLESKLDNLNILIVDSVPRKSEKRRLMKKICDFVGFTEQDPMDSNCTSIFSLHRVDNNSPLLIPSDLSNEIMDFLLK